jgi:hypothetical protein
MEALLHISELADDPGMEALLVLASKRCIEPHEFRSYTSYFYPLVLLGFRLKDVRENSKPLCRLH